MKRTRLSRAKPKKKAPPIDLPKMIMCPAAGTWCRTQTCILKRVKTKDYNCPRKQ